MNKQQRIMKERLALEALLKRVGYKPNRKRSSPYEIPDYKVDTNGVKMSNNVCLNGHKKPQNTYTGTELLGIGVLQKSNLVPIRKDSNDAIDISKMRR